MFTLQCGQVPSGRAELSCSNDFTVNRGELVTWSDLFRESDVPLPCLISGQLEHAYVPCNLHTAVALGNVPVVSKEAQYTTPGAWQACKRRNYFR